jgi:hypothetical protein
MLRDPIDPSEWGHRSVKTLILLSRVHIGGHCVSWPLDEVWMQAACVKIAPGALELLNFPLSTATCYA